MNIAKRVYWIGRELCLCAWLFFLLSGTANAQENMTLNLQDADIRAVISTVSEKTGKNFIVDPRVKGKITVISSEPQDAEALYQTFLAVLDVHGFTAVPSEDGVIKIIPTIVARETAGTVASSKEPGMGDEYVTRVIHINHANAQELMPVLRPLLPQDGHMAAVSTANALVVSGMASNLTRLVKIIDRIDKESSDEVEVIRLSHASSAEVVRIMNSLDTSSKKSATRLNVVADERTNSVLLSGPPSQRLKYRAIIAHLDTPLENEGNVEVIYLKYAKAKDLAPILIGASQGIQDEAAGGKGGRKGETSVYIEADENTNSLVINAPQGIMGSLKTVVRKLDFRPAQIHVEAVIAEVTAETASELGVQWGFQDTANNASAGAINFGRAGSGLVDLGNSLISGSLPAYEGMTIGVGSVSGSVNIVAVVRALAADADNNILSTPSLMTMDNQEAEIVVGKEVPFLTGSYTSTGNGSTPTNPFQTYERKDVGLTLRVLPQINEGNSVRLNIAQEVSTISSTTSGAADIVTNKRSLNTSVLVDDGKTIVLGGLIDELLRDNEDRVPLLGDIPGVGQLFRYNKSEKVKTNLMVFLKPTIVHGAEDAVSIADGKYNYMRTQQLRSNERARRSILDNEPVPLLPPTSDDPQHAPAENGQQESRAEEPAYSNGLDVSMKTE